MLNIFLFFLVCACKIPCFFVINLKIINDIFITVILEENPEKKHVPFASVPSLLTIIFFFFFYFAEKYLKSNACLYSVDLNDLQPNSRTPFQIENNIYMYINCVHWRRENILCLSNVFLTFIEWQLILFDFLWQQERWTTHREERVLFAKKPTKKNIE